MITYTIYIIDDEKTVRDSLGMALEADYAVASFKDAESALAAMDINPPDLVLLDIGLPGMSGIEALEQIKQLRPQMPVIMITAYEEFDTVIAAMKLGAHDYVVKPIHMESLEITIKNGLETIRLRKEIEALQDKYIKENLPCFIGESDQIQGMMAFLAKVAQSPDTPVLICGETGTGKELIASAVHYRSPNFKGNFVPVNCAAIPKDLIESEIFGYTKGAFSGAAASGKRGLIEDASQGTLFLDEIGDLGLEAQAKLLRFLENGEFYKVGGVQKMVIQTRIVSATNKNLEQMIEEGLFRSDLYFRIGVIKIQAPSLSQRLNDIKPLAEYFLCEFSQKFGKTFTGLSSAAEEALKKHPWTGNVRELKNLIERGVLIGRGPELTTQDLGLEARLTAPLDASGETLFRPLPPEGLDFPKMQRAFEKYYLGEAHRLAKGNASEAAKLLNINHHTFRYRHKKLFGK